MTGTFGVIPPTGIAKLGEYNNVGCSHGPLPYSEQEAAAAIGALALRAKEMLYG